MLTINPAQQYCESTGTAVSFYFNLTNLFYSFAPAKSQPDDIMQTMSYKMSCLLSVALWM